MECKRCVEARSMWARRCRALRRALLLLPLALTALAPLLLPRPPPAATATRPCAAAEPEPQPRPEQQKLEEPEPKERDVLPDYEPELNEVQRRPWFMNGGQAYPSLDHHLSPPKLFPEDAPGEDRIVNQLRFSLTPQEAEERPIKHILLASGLKAWGVAEGQAEFVRNRCPVDRCSITANQSRAPTVDAILYKDYYTPFHQQFNRPPNQIWILYYLESPPHTSSLRLSALDAFNWTATYRRDSDLVAPYERWVYYDPLVTEKELDKNYAANKTRKVAWFVSNCRARNRRLRYAKQLAKHIQVDIYGACGTLGCPRATAPNCFEMLNRDYKFYLSFENSNCKDYITEKLFVNGLQHDVLPIVMGARPEDYAAQAPHKSYVHVEEFTGPRELAAYLRRLDSDDNLYNSYFRWKGTGEFINTKFFCRLCAMVHASDIFKRNKHYHNVQEWWQQGACTRGDWRQQD